MGGSNRNPRFIITASANIGTKDIIAGPPQMIAQNFELVLFVGDALTNTIFSNTTLTLKGVGTNENKAFIEALKAINPKNKEIVKFLEEGKNKIINYYSTNCDFILKDAQTLVSQEKYNEAIYKLSLIPDVCQDCYFKSLDTLAVIYQQKTDADCQFKLNEAKIFWAANQNAIGAQKAGEVILTTNPFASCQPEINSFLTLIQEKLKADERERWIFKMKKHQDEVDFKKEQLRLAEEKSIRDDNFRDKLMSRNFELDKMRIDSYREVALEYVKNQPQNITYNNIYWK